MSQAVGTPATLGWWHAGEAFAAAAVAGLPDSDLGGPSLLPGWSRRTVVAHLAGNADALVNLMTWARTGVETPMYATPEARSRGIEQIAALPDAELRARLAASSARLAEAIENAPAWAWDSPIRTAQGREVPAGQVPWMRCREVWVHAVDLDAGPGFSDIGDDVLTALVDDVVQNWTQRGEFPDVVLRAGPRTWGAGTVAVDVTLAELAAILTGRASAPDTQGVPLPRWI